MPRSGRFANLELAGQPRADADAVASPTPGPAPARPQNASPERSAGDYLQRARDHELAGDLEQALRDLAAALGEDPLCLDAWVGQLWMLVGLDECQEACVWADKALARFPDNPLVLAAKAVALHRLGRCREAMDLNDAALAAHPGHALLWLSRGELLMKTRAAVAENCFVRARQEDGAGPEIGLRVGAICLRYGRPAWALAALQAVVARDDRGAQVWHLLGCAQSDLGMTAAAAHSFRRAVDLAPHLAAYRQALEEALRPSLAHRLTALWRRLTPR